MYVAVKGGEKAIANVHKLLYKQRHGSKSTTELGLKQIMGQLKLAVDRVMAEGSLYAPELAALAVKQAQGDLQEAVFLLRAARTTFAHFGYSQAVNTEDIRISRRISATWKDLPGGQILGATYDYTHRLLDETLTRKGHKPDKAAKAAEGLDKCPKAMRLLTDEQIIERFTPHNDQPLDITRTPLVFPATREQRLQNLARADEGFLLSLAYSCQRGFSAVHPFVSEMRKGHVSVEFVPEELGFVVTLAEIEITECEIVSQFNGTAADEALFTRGYGLVFGDNEKKALSMAIVDRALRAAEFNEPEKGPAQNEEFVMLHSDNVEAAGFVQHIKLPHYVDFQAELSLLRSIRANRHKG